MIDCLHVMSSRDRVIVLHSTKDRERGHVLGVYQSCDYVKYVCIDITISFI